MDSYQKAASFSREGLKTVGSRLDPARRAALHTLGCRLNQAETARLADQLQRGGFTIVPWGEAAELIVINSCTVTGVAARKTRHAARAARRQFPAAFIVLAGCDATISPETWSQEPAVNLVVPNAAKHRLAELLPATLDPAARPGPIPRTTDRGNDRADAELFREPGCGLHLDKTRANLKIQEGCDFGCSYCIIPQARGRPRSRAWDDVLRETRELAAGGCREIVLTGINLMLYNDHGRRLPQLLTALLEMPGAFRLRISSLEPGPELGSVVAIMARQPRLCRHLHVPLQYGEDGILHAMRRRYTVREFAEFANAASAVVPGLCLGSDVIVGFPGETDAAFSGCCQAIEALPLAYLHVFTFSPRPATPAASLPNRVHGTVVQARFRALEAIGRRKAAAFAAGNVGTDLTVLTEVRNAADNWEGRADNYLEVEVEHAPPTLGANDMVRVQVTDSRGRRGVRGHFIETVSAGRPASCSFRLPPTAETS